MQAQRRPVSSAGVSPRARAISAPSLTDFSGSFSRASAVGHEGGPRGGPDVQRRFFVFRLQKRVLDGFFFPPSLFYRVEPHLRAFLRLSPVLYLVRRKQFRYYTYALSNPVTYLYFVIESLHPFHNLTNIQDFLLTCYLPSKVCA